MVTMTATLQLKSTTDRSSSNSLIEGMQSLTTSPTCYSNILFPTLANPGTGFSSMSSPQATTSSQPSATTDRSTAGINRTDALLFKSNLLFHSSLYDRLQQPPQKQSETMVTNNSVINTRVHQPPQSRERKSLDVAKSLEDQYRSLNSDQRKQLSNLLYVHFSSENRSASHSDLVPIGYNEEDPHTWPSNWLAQVPTMILEPEKYLSSKPTLNEYQQKLIYRISAKYEPLVRQYIQQLLVTAKNDSSNNGSGGGDGGGGLDDNNNSLGWLEEERFRCDNSSKPPAPSRYPAVIKTAAQQPALLPPKSSNVETIISPKYNSSIGSNQHARDKCSMLGDNPDLPIPTNNTTNSAFDSPPSPPPTPPSTPIYEHKKIFRDPPPPPPLVIRQKSSTVTQLNKWSNKMKIYLKKNC